MANQDFFTNLPPKDKDELQKTVDELVQNQYQEKFQFNAGEFDAAIAFFVKRGFKLQPLTAAAIASANSAARKRLSYPITSSRLCIPNGARQANSLEAAAAT